MSPLFRKRPATYADIEALPPHLTGEIVGDELFVSPRPALRHAVSTSALGGMLVPPFQFGTGGPGGWWILDEPEIHLGRDVLVPDLAGWRRERHPAPPRDKFMTIAPDWVCEVLSPSTARFDRRRKQAVYGREQVGHLWMVDPLQRTLEVYRLTEGGWLQLAVYSDDDPKVRVPPFGEIEIDLTWVWGEPEPDAESDPEQA